MAPVGPTTQAPAHLFGTYPVRPRRDGRRLTLPGLPAAVAEQLHAWVRDAAAPPSTPST